MTESLKNLNSAPPAVQAVRPTGMTLFFRNWIPWQIIRFIVINIKMTVMIAKSHDKKIE